MYRGPAPQPSRPEEPDPGFGARQSPERPAPRSSRLGRSRRYRRAAVLDTTAPVKHTQTVSNGDRCYSSYRIVGDDLHPNAASLAAAQAALRDIDIDALDISDDIKHLNKEYSHLHWSGPGPRPDYFYPTDSIDSVEASALSSAIYHQIVAEVRAQGLRNRGFSMESEWKCDDYKKAITGE